MLQREHLAHDRSTRDARAHAGGRCLGHNGIGYEHLLLGVLADEDANAGKVLEAHGVTLDAARPRVAEICGDGWHDAVRWTHSPRATVVRTLAQVEAKRLDHEQPTDVHLVLAMITEGAGVPNSLFRFRFGLP